MCLSTVYSGKQKQAKLRALPDTVTGWKLAETYKYKTKIYRTFYREYRIILNRIMVFKTNSIGCFGGSYIGGCHIYLKKPNWPWIGREDRTSIWLKATFKKKTIQAIGRQDGMLCVTVSEAKFTRIK